MSERRQYPSAGNLVRSWERTGESGTGAIEVDGSDEPVTVQWTGYRNTDGSYESFHEIDIERFRC